MTTTTIATYTPIRFLVTPLTSSAPKYVYPWNEDGLFATHFSSSVPQTMATLISQVNAISSADTQTAVLGQVLYALVVTASTGVVSFINTIKTF